MTDPLGPPPPPVVDGGGGASPVVVIPTPPLSVAPPPPPDGFAIDAVLAELHDVTAPRFATWGSAWRPRFLNMDDAMIADLPARALELGSTANVSAAACAAGSAQAALPRLGRHRCPPVGHGGRH